MSSRKISIFWFRRDLRLNDNVGLMAALKSSLPVVPIFIFDSEILEDLPKDDARVTFIYDQLVKINQELKSVNSNLLVLYGKPETIWKNLTQEYEVSEVYFNHDYEPYAINRDKIITEYLTKNGVKVQSFKDHVFFEKDEITKADGLPYTVYTAYKNKWLEKFKTLPGYHPEDEKTLRENYLKLSHAFPSLEKIGFKRSTIAIPEFRSAKVKNYGLVRDFPAKHETTFAGHHLRFGTISVRSLVYFASQKDQIFLSEIVWRDFFSQILFHFPHVVQNSFKKPYDYIQWENDADLFDKWCNGKTGYPIVDAGMNQLNQTGFMHNRVRMIVASFLVKHLLIDWRWGEAYFAEKLLDFDLASNNGNWQWAAGCGCDAAPYFRVFSPALQQERFDPKGEYLKQWIPNFDPKNYLEPIVEHKFARDRAIKRFKEGIESGKGN
jgi:deoxyribodipyrimidine photo-lyase